MKPAARPFTLLLGIALIAAQPVLAQEDPGDRPDAAARLENAQQRLEDAAREIAELTSELGGRFGAAMEGLDLGHRRAVLGVNIADQDRKREQGVEITGVSPGGPADEAGLETGDVLLALNGEPLEAKEGRGAAGRLLELMRDIEPGDTVKLEYERAGKKRNVEVETKPFGPHAFTFALGDDDFQFDLPHVPLLPHPGPFYGQWGRMELTSLTPGLGSYFGTDEGLLVVRAPDDEALGLRDGDVILGIAGRKPDSPEHALRILRSYRPGEQLSIDIIRKQKKQTLDLTMPDTAFDKVRFHAPADRIFLPRRALWTI